MRDARTCASGAQPAQVVRAILAAFSRISHGRPLALVSGVIWFLEKQDDLLVCEIRRAQDDQTAFEFEIADSTGPTTLRFGSPKELITKYLDEQQRLFKDGWRPTSGDLAILE